MKNLNSTKLNYIKLCFCIMTFSCIFEVETSFGEDLGSHADGAASYSEADIENGVVTLKAIPKDGWEFVEGRTRAVGGLELSKDTGEWIVGVSGFSCFLYGKARHQGVGSGGELADWSALTASDMSYYVLPKEWKMKAGEEKKIVGWSNESVCESDWCYKLESEQDYGSWVTNQENGYVFDLTDPGRYIVQGRSKSDHGKTDTATITVLGVKSIRAEGYNGNFAESSTSDPNDPNIATITVAVGTVVNFLAAIDPSGEVSWPDNDPQWEIVKISGSRIVNLTTVGVFMSGEFNDTGVYRVSASCGSSYKYILVTVVHFDLTVDLNNSNTKDFDDEVDEDDPGAASMAVRSTPDNGEPDLNSCLRLWIDESLYDPNAEFILNVSTSSVIRLWIRENNAWVSHAFPYRWPSNESLSEGNAYIEGMQEGNTNLTLTYEKNGNSVPLSDTVACAVGTGELTAYRPRHGSGYTMFQRRAVSDLDEESTTLGPGIRTTHHEDSDYDGGDSLIELTVERSNSNMQLVLRRSSPVVKVWYSSNRGTELEFEGSTVNGPSKAINFGGSNSVTLWVEYWWVPDGPVSLTLTPKNSDVVFDKVKFHVFNSVVVAFGGGGTGQEPSDPADPNHGTFDIAIRLYNSGYNVYMYNEKHLDPSGDGFPYDNVVNSIQKKAIKDIVIFGYSQGGGSTYNLAQKLNNNRGVLPQFAIKQTAYIDGIKDEAGTLAEDRLPPGSLNHINHYQRNFFELLLKGVPTTGIPAANNINVTQTTWGANAKHGEIDDLIEVKDKIVAEINTNVQR